MTSYWHFPAQNDVTMMSSWRFPTRHVRPKWRWRAPRPDDAWFKIPHDVRCDVTSDAVWRQMPRDVRCHRLMSHELCHDIRCHVNAICHLMPDDVSWCLMLLDDVIWCQMKLVYLLTSFDARCCKITSLMSDDISSSFDVIWCHMPLDDVIDVRWHQLSFWRQLMPHAIRWRHRCQMTSAPLLT
jgi:hypothetical protein